MTSSKETPIHKGQQREVAKQEVSAARRIGKSQIAMVERVRLARIWECL